MYRKLIRCRLCTLLGRVNMLTKCWLYSGTPFWKLVLKQFDDLLVKVRCCAGHASLYWTALATAWAGARFASLAIVSSGGCDIMASLCRFSWLRQWWTL